MCQMDFVVPDLPPFLVGRRGKEESPPLPIRLVLIPSSSSAILVVAPPKAKTRSPKPASLATKTTGEGTTSGGRGKR